MGIDYGARREERHAVRADIRLTGPDSQTETSMIDVSRGGLGTDGLMHFPPDTPVRITFPDGSGRMGRTMWQDGFWSGILFDIPLSDEELAALLLSLRQRPHFEHRAA